MSDTLWSDDMIIARFNEAFGVNPDVHIFALLRWMRDDLTKAAPDAACPADAVEGTGVAQGGQYEPVEDGTYQWSEQEAMKISGAKLELAVRPLETYYDSFGNPHQRLLIYESVKVDLPEQYRVCRRVDAPAVAQGVGYSHRNGETEPPTEIGRYLFYGIAAGERYEGSVTVATAIAGNLCVEGASEATFEEMGRWGKGQWWGPITLPWDAYPEGSQPHSAKEVDDEG